MIVAGHIVFGVSWPGDWVALAVFAVAGVVCFALLGIALSHAIPNPESAPAYVNAVFLPQILIAGVFYDADEAPDDHPRHRAGAAADAPRRRTVGSDGRRRGRCAARGRAARARVVGGRRRRARGPRLLLGSSPRELTRLRGSAARGKVSHRTAVTRVQGAGDDRLSGEGWQLVCTVGHGWVGR